MIEFNLFRDDLESGLNHQSFEVQANNLDDGALSFSNDKIQCYLSSEKQWHGFLLKGEISFSFLVLCDRCVSKYEDKQNSSFEIVLTDNNDLLQKKSDDILRFDKSEKLQKFSEKLENVCIKTIESGMMTKDLALLVGKDKKWMETMDFINEIDKNLKKAFS